MKILYTVSNPYGLGADRWIYEGYRDAFIAEGHEFYTMSEFGDFQKKALEAKPDLLLFDFGCLERWSRTKPVPPEFFGELKSGGTLIFCLVTLGAERDEPPERIPSSRKYLPFFDLCYSYQPPETTHRFQELSGRELYFIPPAANTRYLFPDKPDRRFLCDIAFVGSFYTFKKEMFSKLLYPARKRYKILIYGPGWTLRDRFLRLGSGVARRVGWETLTRLINNQRLTISQDDERKLYASAKICLNIHEYYEYYPDNASKGMLNEREFKIPAAGGFQLSDYVQGMERNFELGKEIAIFKSPEDGLSKIEYYLKNEKERKEIQEAGTARVLREHTYRHRVRQIINLYKQLG